MFHELLPLSMKVVKNYSQANKIFPVQWSRMAPKRPSIAGPGASAARAPVAGARLSPGASGGLSAAFVERGNKVLDARGRANATGAQRRPAAMAHETEEDGVAAADQSDSASVSSRVSGTCQRRLRRGVRRGRRVRCARAPPGSL